MLVDEIKEMIENGLPGAIVMLDGDGTHFQAVIVSDDFAGKSMVKRHQMVYKALGDKMGKEIHALSFSALTTEEWQHKYELGISR